MRHDRRGDGVPRGGGGDAGDLPATLDAHLRRRDLDRLRAGGPVSRLLARQAIAHSDGHAMGALGRAHPGLPDDLLDFQHDAAACAVAAGMPVATLENLVLALRHDGGVLRFEDRPDGRAVTVTTADWHDIPFVASRRR